MTVQELITHLQTLSPHGKVVVPGYEGGYGDVTEIELVQLRTARDGYGKPEPGVYEIAEAEEDTELVAYVLE